jgi:hypothetical protein
MMTDTPHKSKTTLGRAAFISFPEFGLESVAAKTDTGAYRSAVHATNIKVKNVDGKDVLSFDILSGHKNSGQLKHVEMTKFREVEVENSFGHSEMRYEVMILCKLEGRRFRTSFTLANRAQKTYPVLMGRRLTNRRFIIDTSIAHIDRRLLKKQYNIELPKDEEEA